MVCQQVWQQSEGSGHIYIYLQKRHLIWTEYRNTDNSILFYTHLMISEEYEIFFYKDIQIARHGMSDASNYIKTIFKIHLQRNLLSEIVADVIYT